MHGPWGSCHDTTSRLTLVWRIIKAPGQSNLHHIVWTCMSHHHNVLPCPLTPVLIAAPLIKHVLSTSKTVSTRMSNALGTCPELIWSDRPASCAPALDTRFRSYSTPCCAMFFCLFLLSPETRNFCCADSLSRSLGPRLRRDRKGVRS